MYYGVLCVDICQWQFYDGEQFCCCWVFFCLCFIGDNMYGINWEFIVCVVWQFSINIFLFVWQRGEWYLQLDDIFIWFYYVVYLVWGSGVINYWFIFFKVGDGVGYYC